MKQISIILFLIILCGCSSKGTQPSTSEMLPPSPTSSSEISEVKIELLDAIDATNLSYLEPLDDNTVFIIGAKRDKSLPKRELIYAVCFLDTGKVSVLHREIISINWADNMDVYTDEMGKIKLFTGQQILTIDNFNVENIKKVVDQQYEVFVDLKNDKMVFTDGVPPSLYYSTIGEDNRTLIFESKEVEFEGKNADIFPYSPQLNKNGDKILYGTTIDDTSHYQSVAISSVDGSMLAETDQLPINADYLDMLWYKDGFITIEVAENYNNSPTGLAMLLTEYNSDAEEVNKMVLHGISLGQNYQRKIYANNSLFAFSYKTDSTNGLALWNVATWKIYYVRNVEGYVLSPTVTPDGSKLLWFNNGFLYADKINIDRYEQLPTY